MESPSPKSVLDVLKTELVFEISDCELVARLLPPPTDFAFLDYDLLALLDPEYMEGDRVSEER